MEYVILPRESLSPFSNKLVKVSGRIKEIRKHPTRRDLDNVLLTNVFVTPEEQDTVLFDHIWILKRQLRRAKIPIIPGSRITFTARVYKYRRRGGLSQERGVFNKEDYGLMPVENNEN